MHESMSVRLARAGDLASVDALLAHSYPRLLKADYPPSVLVTAIPLISRAKPALLTSGRYFVAERTGPEAVQVVGAGGWSRDRTDAHLGHIRHVATDPDVVRQGVGRALMEAVFAQAAAQGITGFQCYSTRTAVPFYAALGFAEVGPVEVPLAAGVSFPSVLMRRGAAPGRDVGGPMRPG